MFQHQFNETDNVRTRRALQMLQSCHGLDIKCSTFLSEMNQIWIFSNDFNKAFSIRYVTCGQMDKGDEANRASYAIVPKNVQACISHNTVQHSTYQSASNNETSSYLCYTCTIGITYGP